MNETIEDLQDEVEALELELEYAEGREREFIEQEIKDIEQEIHRREIDDSGTQD